MPLVVKCDNGTVTDTYLEIIGEALSNLFDNIRYTNNINDALNQSKNDLIVVARTVDAFKLVTKGYKKVVIWFQGVEPEESYMNHHSKIRFSILSFMEKLILKKSYFRFFVSSEMMHHYEKKYNLHFEENGYYCMPCLNTDIHETAFKTRDKYTNNSFIYIGSLAVWQKFDETVKVYKMIEDSGLPSCEFRVYTSQKEEAKRILVEHKVKNYKIDFVDNNQLPAVISDVKYGFIIREDTTVNRVATPTKLSTYLSCGIIPIYSPCLKDFAELATNMKYAIVCDDNIVKSLHVFSQKQIEWQDVLDEYQCIFNTHYSRSQHISNMIHKLKTKINEFRG